MKVAVVNTFHAKDITKWSGIPYHLSIFFDSIFGNDVRYVCVPKLDRSLLSYVRGLYFNRIRKKKYYTWADEKLLNANRLKMKEFLAEGDDLIITFEFYMVPLLKTKFNKVIYWNDGTFENLYNFYSGYSNFSNYSFKAAHLIQKKALELSDGVIYSSDWAIESAVSFYKTERAKLWKILFASNFKTSLLEKDIDEFISVRRSGVLKLLFLTADWERKGGLEAVKLVEKLNKHGIKSLLYVVGTTPPEVYRQHQNIVHIGFINKDSIENEKKLVQMFRECAFLVMPTRVDTTPVAFSEAASFALPVIATNVGAIASIIEKNKNGCSFDVPEFVEKAAAYISERLPGTSQYEKFCYSSYDYYQQNMSWEQVKKRFLHILDELELPLKHNSAFSVCNKEEVLQHATEKRLFAK